MINGPSPAVWKNTVACNVWKYSQSTTDLYTNKQCIKKSSNQWFMLLWPEAAHLSVEQSYAGIMKNSFNEL